jgi:hypothetical protein
MKSRQVLGPESGQNTKAQKPAGIWVSCYILHIKKIINYFNIQFIQHDYKGRRADACQPVTSEK